MSSLHCTSQQYATHTHTTLHTHHTPLAPICLSVNYCNAAQCNTTHATQHSPVQRDTLHLITSRHSLLHCTTTQKRLQNTAENSALHNTALHYTAPHSTYQMALHYTSPHYIILHHTTINYVTLYTLKYITPLCSTLPHSTTSYHHDHLPTRSTTVC